MMKTYNEERAARLAKALDRRLQEHHSNLRKLREMCRDNAIPAARARRIWQHEIARVEMLVRLQKGLNSKYAVEIFFGEWMFDGLRAYFA